MLLFIKALSGPQKSQSFQIKEGLSIGRQGADIALNDPKVSSLHALVTQGAAGQTWFLNDNGSKNGIRVKNEKTLSVELISGVHFWIGDSEFTVEELIVHADIPPKPSKPQRYWHDILADFLKQHVQNYSDAKSPKFEPLSPALVLEFVRGSQASSKWILGFGPRKIGPTSLDLPIWEAGAPALCFEILPSSNGLVFKTSHPDIVLLNGKSVEQDVLRIGDTIHILDTLIEVDFTE